MTITLNGLPVRIPNVDIRHFELFEFLKLQTKFFQLHNYYRIRGRAYVFCYVSGILGAHVFGKLCRLCCLNILRLGPLNIHCYTIPNVLNSNCIARSHAKKIRYFNEYIGRNLRATPFPRTPVYSQLKDCTLGHVGAVLAARSSVPSPTNCSRLKYRYEEMLSSTFSAGTGNCRG